MEFFSGYDQFVSNLATNNEQDNLGLFYIIQHTKITHTQFEFGQRIWSELLDRPCWRCRLFLESGDYCRLNDTLLANRQ
jgi:hypothetical protein